MATLGPKFKAKRDSLCSRCPREIKKDDTIRGAGRGEYVCWECAQVIQRAMPAMGANEAGVMHDLESFPFDAQEGALAQTMIYLARQLDQDGVIPRDTAAYVTTIRQNLVALREMYPPKQEADETSQAQDRRMNAMGFAAGE
jgi:hypothetical protein